LRRPVAFDRPAGLTVVSIAIYDSSVFDRRVVPASFFLRGELAFARAGVAASFPRAVDALRRRVGAPSFFWAEVDAFRARPGAAAFSPRAGPVFLVESFESFEPFEPDPLSEVAALGAS